jgi:lysophospholipase L1-like esterase
MRERFTCRAALVLGVLGLALLAARAEQVKESTATKPEPRKDKEGKNDPNWMKRHEGFVAIAKKGGVEVLFLGDSITDAWRSFDEKNMRGGRRIFEKEFAPLKENFGIGGDRTQHVLWRLQNGELDGIQPKVIMLMIGTNNAGSNSAKEIADGIKAIVAEIHKRSPKTKVLLLGVFPRGEKPNPMRDKLKEVNKTIAKLDDGGKTVKYLDIGAKFVQPDGTISKDIMYDFLHLTEKGYRIWADAVQGPIKELMGQK